MIIVMNANTFIKFVLLGLLVSLCAGLAGAANGEELVSIVDRKQISIDETLELTVQYTGNKSRGQPNFDKLKPQFDILSMESGNKIFGNMSNLTSLTQWTMVLSPKREGKLTIPVFSYANLKSAPIKIEVTPPQAAPVGAVKDIFIETVVGKEAVYVQEQLLLKYRLFYSVNVDSLEAEPLQLDNVIKEQIPDVRYSRRINDKVYGIAEFNYALYPQNSGEFVIPSLVWDIKIRKSSRGRSTFFDLSGRYEIKRLRTAEKTIRVMPQPDAFPNDSPWIPATSLQLQENWSEETLEFNIGEPITRTLSLKAEGLMSAQLPQIWDSFDSANVKVYADQPELKDEKVSSGAISERIESAAVVVSGTGDATLPAIRIPWWDVTSDSLRYAELPERKLKAPAAVGARASNAMANGGERPGDIQVSKTYMQEAENLKAQLLAWRIISLALGVALAFLLGTWLFTNRNQTHAPTHRQANTKDDFAAVVKACGKNSPAEIRSALIRWATSYWPDDNVSTLKDIATRVGEAELEITFRKLDAALYSKRQVMFSEGKIIVGILKSFLGRDDKKRVGEALQPFYATG